MRTLYLVSKRLPRVCMGGSEETPLLKLAYQSAPRVHGWFQIPFSIIERTSVCPACAWVVPHQRPATRALRSLPRVCMGGS